MTNGAEATFVMVAFYHYTKMQYVEERVSQVKKKKGEAKSSPTIYKYLVFEKNMALMTFAITVAFLVRSSSLVGWIPLAMVAIFQGPNFISICYNLMALI